MDRAYETMRSWVCSYSAILFTVRIRMMTGCLLLVGGGVAIGIDAQAVQRETHEEKEANFKKQATGELFQRWTFDQDQADAVPAGFVVVASGTERPANWMVQGNTTAPTLPNVVAVSSGCMAQPCYQLLLAQGLEYEYPDLTVRFRASEGTAGIGGVVFGAKDAKNFYAAVVDLVGLTLQVVRMVAGNETVLAHAPVNLKQVDWHSLRVQRNTIISKDFIETFVDGTLVLSVEDQALGLGQVGLLATGKSSLLFDTFHAVPLFSHRPLSAPAAY
ncbi:MAG: hypothetical protein HY038_03945 [Nitrospirae bacterium]|nr:hypothetical protein [Nitrospirota bacterium]